MVHSGYNSLLVSRSMSVRPPARTTRRVPLTLVVRVLSYGPPWAHYLGEYQDRLLSGPLGLLGLGCTAPVGMERKDLGGGVLR
jgi:hypothetical protein